MSIKISILQMQSGLDWQSNADAVAAGTLEASQMGSEILFLPEFSGCLDQDYQRLLAVCKSECETPFVAHCRKIAAERKIWIHVGSLPVLHDNFEGKLANRSLLIDNKGNVVERYDKIHLFEAALTVGESWKEADIFVGGNSLSAARSPVGTIGFSICYDLRFPAIYNRLIDMGANILAVPAAFTVPTGSAHWHVLLRARAIENGAFVVAAAQCGEHQDGRVTYGHSLVVDPWGTVILDMKETIGCAHAEIELEKVIEARKQIPVISNRKDVSEFSTQLYEES
jgi:deaminated glutathione amidase